MFNQVSGRPTGGPVKLNAWPERKSYKASEVEPEEKCPSCLVPTERVFSNAPLGARVCAAESHASNGFPRDTSCTGGQVQPAVPCTKVPGQRGTERLKCSLHSHSSSHMLGRGCLCVRKTVLLSNLSQVLCGLWRPRTRAPRRR